VEETSEEADPLVVEDSGLAVHLLDLYFGVADHDMPNAKKTLSHLRVSVYDISKLDLLLAKLLLVLLQPGLVILDEKVSGMTFTEKGRPKGCILHITRNWSNHELLLGAPPRVRRGAAGLEPVLALAVLVCQSHQRIVLHVVQRGLGEACNRGCSSSSG